MENEVHEDAADLQQDIDDLKAAVGLGGSISN